SQRFFLFSLWWILTVEGSTKVPSTKVSSGISECTHYMSSLNV
ncbi:BgTH12-03044, partial [Blumeria graminis f. sp. triticale]